MSLNSQDNAQQRADDLEASKVPPPLEPPFPYDKDRLKFDPFVFHCTTPAKLTPSDTAGNPS
jgi:hypothetical protein